MGISNAFQIVIAVYEHIQFSAGKLVLATLRTKRGCKRKVDGIEQVGPLSSRG